MILFQGIGWVLTWQAVHIQAKFAAKTQLFQASTPVHEIVLQRDFFQKSKVDKHEIRLEGNLYDIRSFEWKGDSVRLVLYHDWHEQMLFAILDSHISNLDSAATGDAPQPLTVWVAQWLGSAFLLPAEASLPICSTLTEKSDFTWRFPRTSACCDAPFTPPREVFLKITSTARCCA
jgi:hypothetical protein